MSSGHLHHHAVQFYGSDDRLFDTVSGFLADGLVHGEPALIIATKSHTAGILEQLTVRLVDVERARQNGDLVILDAQTLLERFMVGDKPDPLLFEANVGQFVEQLLARHPDRVLRAYGEMVDVLWKQGMSDGAIKLEILWNTLASRFGFALLCGYAMGSFFKQAERMQAICDQHTHVVEDNPVVSATIPNSEVH